MNQQVGGRGGFLMHTRPKKKGPDDLRELVGMRRSPGAVAQDVNGHEGDTSEVKPGLFAADRHGGQRRPSCGAQLESAGSFCFCASGSERKRGGAETPSTPPPPPTKQKKKRKNVRQVNSHT